MSFLINGFFEISSLLGINTPFTRAITFACAGFGIQYFLRPSLSYTTIQAKGGNKTIAKEFRLTSKASPAMTTWVPWYLWPAIFAIIGGLFL